MADMKDPEALHEIGDPKNMKSPTTAAFVNPGTPDAPLVQASDLPNPVASTKGSQALRDNLISHD